MSNKVAESELQKAYKDYFFSVMDTHGIDGLSGLDEEKLKAFFSDVSSGWEKGKGPKKKESAVDRLAALANTLRSLAK